MRVISPNRTIASLVNMWITWIIQAQLVFGCSPSALGPGWADTHTHLQDAVLHEKRTEGLRVNVQAISRA